MMWCCLRTPRVWFYYHIRIFLLINKHGGHEEREQPKQLTFTTIRLNFAFLPLFNLHLRLGVIQRSRLLGNSKFRRQFGKEESNIIWNVGHLAVISLILICRRCCHRSELGDACLISGSVWWRRGRRRREVQGFQVTWNLRRPLSWDHSGENEAPGNKKAIYDANKILMEKKNIWKFKYCWKLLLLILQCNPTSTQIRNTSYVRQLLMAFQNKQIHFICCSTQELIDHAKNCNFPCLHFSTTSDVFCKCQLAKKAQPNCHQPMSFA